MRTFVLAISSVLLLSMNADAALTGIQKCRSYVAKVEMDYAKCLKKGVILQEKGKSSDVSKCDRKRDIGILKAEALYVAKQGVDSDACGLDETSLSISKALMLVAAGEDPADYGISAEALAGTALDATSDNAAVYEDGFDEGVASVDVSSDNGAVCTAAGGQWVAGGCVPASGYNCTLGAICSYFAEVEPTDLSRYVNNYVGHLPGVGDAQNCDADGWSEVRGSAESYEFENRIYWHTERDVGYFICK